MSGTSLDGIDAALVSFNDANPSKTPHLIHAENLPFSPELRTCIAELCNTDPHLISRVCELDIELGELFAHSVKSLLLGAAVKNHQICAIGSHGQTILHHTDTAKKKFSLQVGDPNTIALHTGITTIADFRRMDIAAHGQGAPLVPAFHEQFLKSSTENRVILNIGGMANVTVLAQEIETAGFDTGPGNVLMDVWTEKNTGMPFDKNGAWGAIGQLDHTLLSNLLSHPYFSAPPPKSTGRETFNLSWLMEKIQANAGINTPPETIQRTLTEFTARSITDSIQNLGIRVDRVLLCGGGCHNLDRKSVV